MSNLDEINAFLTGGGGRSAFPEDSSPVGSKVRGKITDLQMANRTDRKTGAVKMFSDGSPQKQLVITLQTDERDGEQDDGIRRFYAGGLSADSQRPTEGFGKSGQQAIKDALAKHGRDTRLEIGGTLSILRSGIGTKSPGQSAPWLYDAKYEPPTKGIANEDW